MTFIVAGHNIDSFSWANNDLERVLKILISNGSILFVFIAGYLFQHLASKHSLKKYYLSKLESIICPYLIISIPAIIVFVAVLERGSVWAGFYDNSIVAQIALFYLTGKHLSPLWFIPMITIFYLIAPLLTAADNNKKIYYFLPLFIISVYFLSRGFSPLQNFIYYFPVYLLGMCFSRFKNLLNPIVSKGQFLLVSFGFILFFSSFEYLYTEETKTYLNFLQKIIMSVFFLGLLIKYNSLLQSKHISDLAKTSFGIYLIHSYVLTSIKLLFERFNGGLPTGDIIVYTTSSLLTILICFAFVILIGKIFGTYSKYIVGR